MTPLKKLSEADELRDEMTALENRLLKRILDHLDYHKHNESKWGLVKMMRDHPFRTVSIGMVLGAILAAFAGPQLQGWMIVMSNLFK